MSDNQQNDGESVALTKWKNPPDLRDLKQNLEASLSNHNAQTTRIDNWLDNLHVRGKALVDTPKGKSKLVPRLIRKQAEWRYGALSEPFLSSPDLFKLSPVSWEDKLGARQNALVLNNQFNTVIDKVSFIDEYVRTAVDEGTAIIRVGWEFEEEDEVVAVPQVELMEDPGLAPLHQELAKMKEEDPVAYRFDVPDELKQAHDYSMETGIPYAPNVTGYEEETQKRTVKNKPTIEICDNHNVILDPSCGGNSDKAQFIIYSFESSKGLLAKDSRYKNLDKIQIENNSPLTEPDHNAEVDTGFSFDDEPRKQFVVYEYWGYWDIEGDGTIKPIIASWVGDTLIRLEENPYPDKKPPFIVVQYLPVRKNVYGEPDGHLLEDNQRVAGAVTRGMIDIMAKAANGQTGTSKNVLDATNRRKFRAGQDYEFNPIPGGPAAAIYTHTFPEIPSSAQFMLQLQNVEAESLTGVKAFSGGISGDALGNVATGIRGALDAASRRELGILRRLANGMIKAARKITSMNAAFLEEEEVVRVTNDEFVVIRRDDLGGSFDYRLAISTAEEDNAKAQELAFMLQTSGSSADPQEIRIIRAEIARLRKMPDLAKQIEEYQPAPNPFQQEKEKLELDLLRAQIQKELSMAQENGAEAQLDMAKAGTEMAQQRKLGSEADMTDLNFVEQESGVKQERDLQKQGEQAKGNMKLKMLGATLDQQQETRKNLTDYLKKSG